MPTGLLFSQIGYEPTLPARVVVRSEKPDFLSNNARCELWAGESMITSTGFAPAVEQWGSQWWMAEFPARLVEDEYAVRVTDGGKTVLAGDGFRVRSGVLWNSTVEIMATEMLEARARIAPAGCGWQDAGGVWQESNTQSAMILGLADVLEFAKDKLGAGISERIHYQISHGCEYLIKTQEKAEELGFAKGSLSHDLLGHEKAILPGDALKAVVAWRRAARFLPNGFDRMRNRANAAADKALAWLTGDAKPLGDMGFCRRQRGLPPKAEIPADEWMTRDLVTLTWAAVETYRAAQYEAKDLAIDTARQIMDRQIAPEEAEGGALESFHGHFREFTGTPHSEKAWSHSIYGNQFGADAGGAFPNYLIPLVEMLKLWPDHEDAEQWRKCLEQFADGFLIPACQANPFLLAPYGVIGEEGLIWFAGPWHGFNCIYAYTAALALELADLLDKDELREIAYANLQWVSGLNAGVTADSLALGSHIFRADIPPDAALPASMIHGVGNRTAGTWFATRGVICNGFATGDQFKFDTDPTRVEDGPHSFTDEDWITHNAAWLSAMARLRP